MTAITAPRARVDPRLRARWVANRRTAGRRRLRRVVVATAVFATAGVAVGITFSPLLAVHRVDVVGAGPDHAAVLHAAHISAGSPMLYLDAGDAAAAVRRLPQVESARVERHFPTTVSIRVTLRVPAAWALTRSGQIAVLDGHGVVMSDTTVPPVGLPALVGLTRVGGPGTRVAPPLLAAAAAALPAGLRTGVLGLTVDPTGVVALVAGGGPVLRFGDATRLAVKAQAALAVLGALPRPVRYVDVSVPDAPVAG